MNKEELYYEPNSKTLREEPQVLTRWQDPTIEMLNKKIEAQDKIINTQALEIARLKEINNTIKEVDRKLLERIDNAIEYINKRMVHEGEYYIRKAFHFRNTEYGKDLLEILEGEEIKELLEILGGKE